MPKEGLRFDGTVLAACVAIECHFFPYRFVLSPDLMADCNSDYTYVVVEYSWGCVSKDETLRIWYQYLYLLFIDLQSL